MGPGAGLEHDLVRPAVAYDGSSDLVIEIRKVVTPTGQNVGTLRNLDQVDRRHVRQSAGLAPALRQRLGTDGGGQFAARQPRTLPHQHDQQVNFAIPPNPQVAGLLVTGQSVVLQLASGQWDMTNAIDFICR